MVGYKKTEFFEEWPVLPVFRLGYFILTVLCNQGLLGAETTGALSVIAEEPQYQAWMIAGLSGDADAYRQLLAALTRHLRAFYLKRVGTGAAEDLVQETLIAIHTRRGTYDLSQPLTSWVFGIARYKLIDEYRREKRRATVPLDEAPELFANDEATASAAKRDVEKLLLRLPEAQRQLVRDIKLTGASVADVAARTGMSESAVKVTVHRAVRSLGEDFQEGDHAD